MAVEQDWAAYANQAYLAATDTLLARTAAGAGVEIPGSAIWAQRTAGGPFSAIGSASAARLDLTTASPTFIYTNPASSAYAVGTHDALSHKWLLSSSYGMALDASCNLLVNTTDVDANIAGSTGPGMQFSVRSAFGLRSSMSDAHYWNRLGGAGQLHNFRCNGTAVGSISVSTSATSFNTSSDHRLKEDYQPLTGALARIRALPVYDFRWIESGERARGFKAHEYGEAIPGAATGTKDGMREEEFEIEPARLSDVLGPDGMQVMIPPVMGKRTVPDYQGIDQSKAVPDLVGAVQEMAAMIDELRAEVAALKAAASA